MSVYAAWIAIVLDSASGVEHTSKFTLLAEGLLQEFAMFLKVFLEGIAVLTVAIALILTLRKIFHLWRRDRVLQETIRLELGVVLALALEFLLAADIVGTAISPSWDAVAKLAAITGIRTFLNFFLQREVRELRETAHSLEGKVSKELK
ncbi:MULTISPECIES: DUF1622 domain-containing protein [unclassified Nostoc]|uniref:DUF1622 domain-containing protein n=1 Tax=unclassified Nostoc TaxID=2593658 RepID=UPI0026215B82|nr:DUF1622 domain-containing protein [Nostoc sp. S13]MDF5739335.1 DUF1622 domain-containing protein [Nostoc sp. S13]